MNAGRTGSSEPVYLEFTDLRSHNPTIPQGRPPDVWTSPWQELSDVLQHWSGAVTCPAFLMRQVWPLALMLCADRVPIVRMHLKVR